MKKLIMITLMATCAAYFVPAWAEDKSKKDDLKILFEDSDIIKDSQIDKGEFDIFHFRAFMAISVESTAAYVATRSISPEKLISIKFNLLRQTRIHSIIVRK
jgi:hypothetical protein